MRTSNKSYIMPNDQKHKYLFIKSTEFEVLYEYFLLDLCLYVCMYVCIFPMITRDKIEESSIGFLFFN